MTNRVELTAVLESRSALRWTLSKVPVTECVLRHQSVVDDQGSPRKVNFRLNAVAYLAVAHKLQEAPFDEPLKLTGYLTATSARSSKLVLNITEFELGD